MKKQLLLTLLLLSGCCAHNQPIINCDEAVRTYHPVVHFEHNSADLDMHAKHILNEVPKYVDNCLKIQLDITGYTDNTGTSEYNKTLGTLRAQNVQNYLEHLGVNVNRIHTSSMGEKDPVASNDTETGRQQNRRVVIKLK